MHCDFVGQIIEYNAECARNNNKKNTKPETKTAAIGTVELRRVISGLGKYTYVMTHVCVCAKTAQVTN